MICNNKQDVEIRNGLRNEKNGLFYVGNQGRQNIVW